MTIHKDIDNIFENLMWLLDDSPRYEKCRRYLNVNGKEVVNDFKCDEKGTLDDKKLAKELKELEDIIDTDDVFEKSKKGRDFFDKFNSTSCQSFIYDYIKNKKAEANEKRKIEYIEKMLKKKYGINRVIINPPAVIILWDDDTKTIAKCEKGDAFDIEKGFMVAFIKHLIGNKDFHDLLETYVWNEMEDSE